MNVVTSDRNSILGVKFVWEFGSDECTFTGLIDARGARTQEASAIIEKGESIVKLIHLQ